MKRNRAEFSPSGGNGAVEFLSAEYVPTGFSPVTKERRVLARRRGGGFFYRQFGWHRRSFKAFVPKIPVYRSFLGAEVFF